MHYSVAELTDISTLATIAIALIAYFQLSAWVATQKAQNLQHRQWATLQTCDRYDSDPIIREALALIRAHKNGYSLDEQTQESVKYSYDLDAAVVSLMNYFDSIAIGLKQNLYVEEIVREHLEGIIRTHIKDIKEFSDPEVIKRVEKFHEEFSRTLALIEKWEAKK